MENAQDHRNALTIDLHTGDAWYQTERLFLSNQLTVPLVLLAASALRNRTLLEEDLYPLLGLDRESKGDRHVVNTSMNRLRSLLGRQAIRTRIGVGWVLLIPVRLINDLSGRANDRQTVAG